MTRLHPAAPNVVAMAVSIERGFGDASQTLSCKLPSIADTDITISSLSSSVDQKMALERILPLFHHSNWENPKDSIGTPIGRMRNGRYQCWHVKGRALAILHEIKPQLRECIDASPKSGTVTWGMYMVGHREDNAAPKVLICSPEEKIRKEIRKLVKRSKLLDRYPGVGLGDASSLPDRDVPTETAKEEIDRILPPDCDIKKDKVVLIKGMEASPGKWIYTVNSDGRSLRAAATSGPFVFINDTWCQLTVSHPFFPSQPWTSGSPGGQAPIEDDCDFEGMSDVDEEGDLEATACASVSSFSINEESFVDMRSPTETETQDSYIQGGGTSDSETCSTISQFEFSPRYDDGTVSESSDGESGYDMPIETVSEPSDEEEEKMTNSLPGQAQGADLNMSRLQYLGKLGLASGEVEESSKLDYALIVINNGQIPQLTTPQFINPKLVLAKSLSVIDLDEETCPWEESVGTIGLENIDVVTLMSRTGPVSATLIPNPTFLRMAGRSQFQELYPLTLKDATVSEGDSGSPVFDSTGRFCGHIVAGGQGTPHAYVIPAFDIMTDLESHVWGKINLPTQASMCVAKPIGTMFSNTHSTTSSRETVSTKSGKDRDMKIKGEDSNSRVREPCTGLPIPDITVDKATEDVVSELAQSGGKALDSTAVADRHGISHKHPKHISSPSIEADPSVLTANISPSRSYPPPGKEGLKERLAHAPTDSKLYAYTPGPAIPSKPHIPPPPHLRRKDSPVPTPVNPGTLAAKLSEATLQLIQLSTQSRTGEPPLPSGLTVVSAEEELYDRIVESRSDNNIKPKHVPASIVGDNFKTSQRTGSLAKEWRTLVAGISLRRIKEEFQKRKQGSQETVRLDEECGRDSHHHTGRVRDKFRSITTKIGGSHHGGAAKEKKSRVVRDLGRGQLQRNSSFGSRHSLDGYSDQDRAVVG